MDAHILVVDDEPEIADLVEVYLQSEGFTVHTCGSGTEALELVKRQPLDLAILDVMLPDISGFTLCGEIRKEHHFPVLMLTAKAEDTDKITGLTIGADDYMTKPFNPLELVARVKAQLRRYTRYNEVDRGSGDVLDINGLVINRATHECWLYDQPLVLTPIEFDILWMLCENRGQVISAERLFESVWKEKYLDRNNTVMVHIRRLREKMGEPSRNPRFIKTVWGVGYKID
ncbi:DNA-binding response regulator [Flavonifractor sp. An92]|uniref:VanR-ABDEGLN family response regulator transcription factor n=1 Tax=Flavonifractor sp. An92 TaxID=1965666 RepID=UPI000B39B5A5|nr:MULTISPECIES: VanR-ABDEGLN family response regulator transcription factor [unclassified Flavonifractor]OUN05690.1 DNA-binding response regulator [Flavonifractor sp. An92]OUQ17364.1 DNA-binding response regulator [Flavonifractor sp. An135]